MRPAATAVPGAARSWAPPSASLRAGLRPWLGAAAITLALAGIVAARWLATVSGADGLAVGAGFGLALAAFWVAPASRRWRDRLAADARRRHVLVGLIAGAGFGIALVVGATVGASIGGSPTIPGLGRPAAPFLPWVAATVVVATAEEGILRGVLFDRIQVAGGTIAAVAITTLAFALLHVPLYGWHVVPLDLAVGLGFAGLRLSTRSIVAPATAHVVADLATWWL